MSIVAEITVKCCGMDHVIQAIEPEDAKYYKEGEIFVGPHGYGIYFEGHPQYDSEKALIEMGASEPVCFQWIGDACFKAFIACFKKDIDAFTLSVLSCEELENVSDDFLIFAINNDRSFLVDMILNNKTRVRISIDPTLHESAIAMASLLGDVSTVVKELGKGAKVNIGNGAALRYAAGTGRLQIVKMLVEAGASISNNTYQSVKWAAEYGHAGVLEFLSTKMGIDFTTWSNALLKSASENGHIDIVRFIIEHHEKHDPATPWIWDNQSMMFAARNGHLDVVKLLSSRLHLPLGAYKESWNEAREKQQWDIAHFLKGEIDKKEGIK